MRVLFVNVPGFKPLPDPAILNAIAGGAQSVCVTDIAAAQAVLRSSPDTRVLISNAANPELFDTAREVLPTCRTVLVTSDPMEKYSADLGSREDALIDHLIANRLPVSYTTDELRVTIQKLLRGDVFGIDKYLAPGTPIHHREISSSARRDDLNSAVSRYAEECRLGSYTAKLLYGITEELLMNAIFDAPEAAGREKYDDHARAKEILLAQSDRPILAFACDGLTFAISVTDPFGALQREKLFQYVRKVIIRHTNSGELIDTKAGGAGLGLFKILFSCHSLVCNVQTGQRTEVIALLDVRQQTRDMAKVTRSIHYFEA